uniref:Reverse transcriptase Ty1/copia-type domain-containing protein n=1 Tax=Solanum lycopersicum TaxID=4081 RepID=A0A3Q7J8M8_SOLLC
MMSKYEITNLGLLHYFLGLEVKQGEGEVFVSQKKYSLDLPKRFGLVNCKSTATPMNMNKKLQQEDGTGKANARSFRRLVGGLIYLAHIRPYISYSVCVVSRFMSNPSKHHFGAAKKNFTLLCWNVRYGILASYVSNFRLLGFTDSDWGGSVDDRKSTSGNIFSPGPGTITWSSKKQVTTTLSSSKAEDIEITTSSCQFCPAKAAGLLLSERSPVEGED